MVNHFAATKISTHFEKKEKKWADWAQTVFNSYTDRTRFVPFAIASFFSLIKFRYTNENECHHIVSLFTAKINGHMHVLPTVQSTVLFWCEHCETSNRWHWISLHVVLMIFDLFLAVHHFVGLQRYFNDVYSIRWTKNSKLQFLNLASQTIAKPFQQNDCVFVTRKLWNIVRFIRL